MTKNLSIESFNSLRSFLSLSKKKSSLSLLQKSSVYFREYFPLSYPLSFQHRSLSLSCIDRDCDSNIEGRYRDISRYRLWNSSLISGPTSRCFIGENQRMNTKKKGITYMLSYRSFSKKNKGKGKKGDTTGREFHGVRAARCRAGRGAERPAHPQDSGTHGARCPKLSLKPCP